MERKEEGKNVKSAKKSKQLKEIQKRSSMTEPEVGVQRGTMCSRTWTNRKHCYAGDWTHFKDGVTSEPDLGDELSLISSPK